jgi:hypothetical protein
MEQLPESLIEEYNERFQLYMHQYTMQKQLLRDQEMKLKSFIGRIHEYAQSFEE